MSETRITAASLMVENRLRAPSLIVETRLTAPSLTVETRLTAVSLMVETRLGAVYLMVEMIIVVLKGCIYHLKTYVTNDPLSPHDASKHHFTSVKTD